MREPGYYWVRYKPTPAMAVEVARWGSMRGGDDCGWRTVGDDYFFNDADFDVLSERLLPPDWDLGPPIKSEL
jgi:hypothetical protein